MLLHRQPSNVFITVQFLTKPIDHILGAIQTRPQTPVLQLTLGAQYVHELLALKVRDKGSKTQIKNYITIFWEFYMEGFQRILLAVDDMARYNEHPSPLVCLDGPLTHGNLHNYRILGG